MPADPVKLTDVAAWWGAILSTLGAGWEFYKWTHRVKLRVTVLPNSLVLEEEPKVFHVAVEVVNIGDQPVTLTHLLGAHYKNVWQRIRRRPAFSFITLNPAAPLPKLLAPGERWIGSVLQYQLLEHSGGRWQIGIAHAGTGRPILKWITATLVPDDAIEGKGST
jgi:hypothetical protein